jgi:signal transduction histidine kinase
MRHARPVTESMQRTGAIDGNAASATAASRDPAEWGPRLDGLIAMLSHDLRTPLSAISGWLFLLESGKLDPDAQKRALAKIKASVEEQVQLIDDTLTISRGETGRIEIDCAPVQLGEPLGAALETLRVQAAAKGVAVDDATARTTVTIDADAAKLERAVELVLAHALKATPAGGQIRVSAAATPATIVLTVRDNGSGYAMADLPYVLDPFRRSADGSLRTARGADRGLLLAQALIGAHGGTLQVASDGAGTGETFTIELPAAGSGAGVQP